jgi:hypothetical protein
MGSGDLANPIRECPLSPRLHDNGVTVHFAERMFRPLFELPIRSVCPITAKRDQLEIFVLIRQRSGIIQMHLPSRTHIRIP